MLSNLPRRGPSVRPARLVVVTEGGDTGSEVARRAVSQRESVRAQRTWWDVAADDYLAEHGDFLGDARFVWGPEGLAEADAHLLGDVAGRRVLEVGSGAAQCSRWLLAAGADPVAVDVSCHDARGAAGSAARGRAPGAAGAGRRGGLPFADAGRSTWPARRTARVPFVADSAAVMREVARVLRPGGRWVFSVTHPLRWVFPDDPGEAGLVARQPTSTGRRTSSRGRTGRRRTSSTTAPSATGSARSRPPACAWSTWSSPSGRPATTGRGAAGARCAAGCVPGTAIFVCELA